ncbi:MAG: hypothetical protein ABIN79_12060 [Marmoricola sp.]
MDLSAVIFVVLAAAWAVYLIPKALKHHDEMASDRLVEGHSDKVRVLSRHGRSITVEESAVVAVVPEPTGVTSAPPTRAAARRAARNRRRVLGVLVLVAATVVTLAWFAVLPWWSTAIPGAVIVVFLLVARISVRRAQRRRVARPVSVAIATQVAIPVPAAATVSVEDSDTDESDTEDTEDTVGVPRLELEAALADEGSLWDPLPMTLPTYVGKARARRTVRTIALTGINSSGHDETDSALAREAAEALVAAQADEDASEQRRAAGA